MQYATQPAAQQRTRPDAEIVGGEVSFCTRTRFTSLDHHVGNGKQPWREAEAECPGGVEVDHELEFDRLHDRQVGRLLALENAAGVHAGLAICISKVRSVAHQAASFGRLALRIDRRHPTVSRQGSELKATVV